MRKKNIFFGIGLLLFITAAWGIYIVYKPHHNVSSARSDATLDAESLYKDFQRDEPGADKKWIGKVIIVHGKISAVSESGQYVSVLLQTSVDGGINCSLLKTDVKNENKLVAGDSISIKGKCTGYLIDVNLVDCIVITQ
jgi:tRNA_anti-like